MADSTRRSFVKGIPLVAGAGLLLESAAQHSAASEPPPAPAGAGKKVVPGNSPNFSRTVSFDRVLYVSGVLGADPESRKLASPEFEGQCRQVLKNLQASIEAGGSNLAQVLKCTCFLVEASDFDAFNKVYREFFPKDPPARSTVVVKELVLSGAKIELECIAHV